MFLVLRLLRLNKEQKEKLADFSGNLGLVFIATLVMPVFSRFGNTTWYMIVLGLMFTGFCLYASLFFMKGSEKT